MTMASLMFVTVVVIPVRMLVNAVVMAFQMFWAIPEMKFQMVVKMLDITLHTAERMVLTMLTMPPNMSETSCFTFSPEGSPVAGEQGGEHGKEVSNHIERGAEHRLDDLPDAGNCGEDRVAPCVPERLQAVEDGSGNRADYGPNGRQHILDDVPDIHEGLGDLLPVVLPEV